MKTSRALILIAVAAALIIIFPMVAPMNKAHAKAIALVSDTWGDELTRLAEKYGIPRRRLIAITVNESGGNSGATGLAGERGLMQLMKPALYDVNARYFLNFTWDDMYNPLKNLEAGAAYLSILFRRFNDIDLATRAYNVGPDRIALDKTAGQTYLDKVKGIEAGIA